MHKWVTASASVFATAIAGKIVDHYFPAVFPKLLEWAAHPVPAWLSVLPIGLAAWLAWLLWRCSSKVRAPVISVARPTEALKFRPGPHEDIILRVFGGARGAGLKAQLDEVIPKVAADADLTAVELDHAVEALRNAQWLEDIYEPPFHNLKLRLSPEAARYCRQQGWIKAASPKPE